MKAEAHFKATLGAKALAAVAKRAADIDPNSTIPILGHAWLRFDAGKLLITTTDLDRSVTCSVEAEGSGEATVRSSMLAHFAAMARSGDVSLELRDGKLWCRNDEMLHKIPTLPVEDYPVVLAEAIDGGYEWRFPSSRLKRAISVCSGSMDRGKMSRAYMHGINFQFGKNPRLYSTDGHTLTRLPEPSLACKDEGWFMVPAESLPHIERLCDGDGDVVVRLATTKTAASFQSESATVRTKLIEATPPDYERVIPKNNEMSLSLNADATLAAIARATPTDRASNIMSIAFSEDGSVVHFMGRDSDANPTRDSCQTLDADGCGGLRIGVNGQYLKWAISSLGAETVKMTLDGRGSAYVLTKDDTEELRVVMPCRPNESDFAELDAAKPASQASEPPHRRSKQAA